MGIFGYWGEQEQPAPTAELQKLAGDAFMAAFKNKQVMIRRPWGMFKTYPFGGYWDSWAHWDQKNHFTGIESTAPRWKAAPMGGEAAYNWGNLAAQPGTSPDNTLSIEKHRKYFLHSIRRLHGNHLGWVDRYTATNPAVRAGAQEVQKIFGHRFVIRQVAYPRRILAGKTFDVSFSVVNTGSSPFYYSWPVEISLLDRETKEPVCRRLFGNVDITKWMPGDDWDSTQSIYRMPGASYQEKGTFRLPSSIAAGQYILALAVLDPAGLRPSNRFAIRNYFTGGRHPIGYIGVDQDIGGSAEIDPRDFNGFADNTLRYDTASAPKFTLTLNTQHGSTVPAPGNYSYYEGSSVTISVSPSAGYSFIRWSGDIEADATSPVMVVTMDRAKTLTANFVATSLLPPSPIPGMGGEFSFSVAGQGRVFASPHLDIRRAVIYGISGRPVRTIGVNGSSAAWDGADSRRNMVPPGIYTIRFEGAGKSWSIRILRMK